VRVDQLSSYSILFVVIGTLAVFEFLFLLVDTLHYVLIFFVGELAAAGGDEYEDYDYRCHEHAVDHFCTNLAHLIIIAI